MPDLAVQPARPITGLPAVFLMGAVAGVAQSFGRFAFGVVLPAIRNDLDLSNTIAGTLATVNVGAYLLGTLAVSWLAGAHKLLAVMRVGFVLALAGLGLAAIAPGSLVLGVAMFSSGFGGAMIWIPAPVIAAAAMPPEKRSIAVGLLGSGMGAGLVFASQLTSWVRSSMGDDDWRVVYVVLALISLAVLGAAALMIGHLQDQPQGQGGIGGVDALRRMRGWLPLTAAYASFGFMYLLIMAFLATKLEDDNDWSGSRASFAFTLVGLAVAFGGPMLITIAGRVGSRLAMTSAFLVWTVTVFVILPGWAPITYPASFAIGLLFAGIPTTITLYVVQNTTVEDYGPAFAAATLAFGVAQMLGPQIGGLIADAAGSFTPVFVLSAALALLGAAASWRLPKHEPVLDAVEAS